MCDTIYGNHMGETRKTTVYLDAADLRRLRSLAARTDRSTAELIREAVAEYARRHSPPLPRSLGAGRSGEGDLAERSEELMEGLGTSEPRDASDGNTE